MNKGGMEIVADDSLTQSQDTPCLHCQLKNHSRWADASMPCPNMRAGPLGAGPFLKTNKRAPKRRTLAGILSPPDWSEMRNPYRFWYYLLLEVCKLTHRILTFRKLMLHALCMTFPNPIFCGPSTEKSSWWKLAIHISNLTELIYPLESNTMPHCMIRIIPTQ